MSSAKALAEKYLNSSNGNTSAKVGDGKATVSVTASSTGSTVSVAASSTDVSTICSEAETEAMRRHLWNNPGAVLSINSISQKLKVVHLNAYFGQFGEIKELRMPKNLMDPQGKAHRGFALITFVDPKVMLQVLGAAQQKPHIIHLSNGESHKLVTGVMTYHEVRMMGEKPLVQKVAVGPQPPYQGYGTNTFRRVFVKKVTVDINDREFHQYFSQFGDVDYVSRGTSHSSGNMGVAFVTFTHFEPALIVVALREHCIDGHNVVVSEAENGVGSGPKSEPKFNISDGNADTALANDKSDRNSRPTRDRRDRDRSRSGRRSRGRDRSRSRGRDRSKSRMEKERERLGLDRNRSRGRDRSRSRGREKSNTKHVDTAGW